MRLLLYKIADHVFGTDEKRIRTENMVMDKSSSVLGLFSSKIADCARIRFSSARNRRSARTDRRPRKSFHRSLNCSPASGDVDEQPLRALRANHVFGTDGKRIRTENMVMDRSEGGGAS